MRISNWSSDVCSSDLQRAAREEVDIPIERNLVAHIGDRLPFGREGEGCACEIAEHARAANADEAIDLAADMGQRGVDDEIANRPQYEIGRAHVELQSLMRISYAVFCLNKKKNIT